MSESSIAPLPYRNAMQGRISGVFGMYIFLASEVMLFGVLIVLALTFRLLHPHEVVAASRQLHLWIGATNTAILLTSSLFIALGMTASRSGRFASAACFLSAAALLGCCFLALKAIEYSSEYRDGLLPLPNAAIQFTNGPQHLFMNIYLIATALHAIHLIIGIGLVTSIIVSLTVPRRYRLRDRRSRKSKAFFEMTGLYWHLVDVIWIFLYPILYLAR